MVVDGRGIVGGILRTIPRQPTAIPQVNFRDWLDLIDWTGYTSSDGMYLVEQTDLVEQPGYVDRT